MDHDMSTYRSITDWTELKNCIRNSDLSQAEASFLIPQAVTLENVHLVLHETKHDLFNGELDALGEFVKLFDFSDDFSTWETKGHWSFIDDNGELTPAFSRGMQILKELRRTAPQLLPATSDLRR
jgi:hypothetical protein